MIEKDDLLEQLKTLLHRKKNNTYYAQKLGITESEVEELRKELKGFKEEPDTKERTKRVNEEKGTIESTVSEINFDPQTVEELSKLHKIDLTRYKISNYWSKLKSNGKFTSSVFATSKKAKDYTIEDFTKFLENYKSDYKPSPNVLGGLPTSVDVEISLSDFHLAKKTIDGKNNIADRKKTFLETLESLINRVKSAYFIDRIVFPISNDFFHSDTYNGTTTNGTPQDTIAEYNEEYEYGFDLMVEAIKFLKSHCELLKVILVQGNHDRTKAYYLAHALEVYFRPDINISFDREHSITKFIVLGDTFIGYHHGNCKIEDLPLIFATNPDSSLYFGGAKYREVHTGDKHHYMAKEVKGVRIQQMPSLSGTDRWHADHLYVNSIRAGLALIYDPEKGKIAEIEHRI